MAGIAVAGIMLVAMDVHLVIDGLSLFALEPREATTAIAVVVLAGYIFWQGAGAWTSDRGASFTSTGGARHDPG